MTGLNELDFAADPVVQFERWFTEAERRAEIEYANAMCLSTLGVDGYPEGRMVLLKGYSADGFVFYTNSLSPKGKALELNPRAALTFYWDSLGRQIRIQGETSICTEAAADRYFSTRSVFSQIGAWASEQSKPLNSRSELEKRVDEFRERFPDKVSRPPHWKGYCLHPLKIEFWQFGNHRLHDRFLYRRTQNSWEFSRLSP